ncbi:hypothetical protein H0E87_027279 [Populus deltoides]|uniref:Uncharacterized protein n=1 Tax=Populus deltoides TaxID=3696 RepID=A0A8T2WXU9_POPDE|nr:hypothetical protein H0E87_027279 [Populus deltoides]
MAAKLFLTATIVVLISALIAINHEFLNQSSVIEKGHGQLWEWETLSLDGATGPESFALDPLGQGPYAGVSDGRIIKWEEHERRWINFAITSQKSSVVINRWRELTLTTFLQSQALFENVDVMFFTLELSNWANQPFSWLPNSQ